MIFLGLPAVVGVLPSHGPYYMVRNRIGSWAHPVTEVHRAILGSWEVVVFSQLLPPMTITSEDSILMRGVRNMFLLSNVRVFTFLVLFSLIIGNPSTQLSTVVGVLPSWTVGRQGVPLILPDGTIHVRSPHPACRGSYFTWIHHVLSLVPPTVNPH